MEKGVAELAVSGVQVQKRYPNRWSVIAFFHSLQLYDPSTTIRTAFSPFAGPRLLFAE